MKASMRQERGGEVVSAGRVVFFGATELGYRCCERLLTMGVEVAAIVTIPREFRISYSSERPVRNVLYRDFSELGARFDLPVISVEGRMRSLEPQLSDYQPDLLVVVGWYYMLPSSLREVARLGAVGIHGSLLPRYRGGAPLVWAMIQGEKETGVTLFWLGEGVDDGDVVASRSFPIGAEDTIREVLEKAAEASVDLIGDYVPRVLDGSAPRKAQDHSQATHFPQRSPDDGLIDWSLDAESLHNFIRAQTKPYPGAFTVLAGKRVTIWSADVVALDPADSLSGQREGA